MSPKIDINPCKVAFDLHRTLVLAPETNQILLRPGTTLLLESLLELGYTLSIYTHATTQGLLDILNSLPGLEDYFDEIYREEDEDKRRSFKDPRIIGAKFLVDDVEPITDYVTALGLVGILVPAYDDPSDTSEQWVLDVLEKIKQHSRD